MDTSDAIRVNGRTIGAEALARERASFADARDPERSARRAAAMRVLLLDRARERGWLGADALSRDEEDALIGRVLEIEVTTPEPTDAECRRYYDTHLDAFMSGELVAARHVLFAVTPGVPVAALRERAEAVLFELRAHPERFGERARDCSNCPSAAEGGNLGQFGRGEMVSEFDRAVFATSVVGVLPRLVQTRYGFHVVEVVRRVPGTRLPYEAVAPSIAAKLAAIVEVKAIAQYLALLVRDADVDGVDLEAATSPLVQ